MTATDNRRENVLLAERGVKRCCTCRAVQSLDEFSKRRDSKYPSCIYRESRCRSCKRVAVAAWVKRNPEKRRLQHERETQRRADRADRAYTSHRIRRRRNAPAAALAEDTRRARDAARLAWSEWIARAPAWWRSVYDAAVQARRSGWSRRLHIRRVAGVSTGRGSSRESRWAACAEQSDGTLTVAIVEALYAEASTCTYCWATLDVDNRTLDHVVALENGGVHGVGNLAPACRSCNTSKGTKLLEVWRSERKGTPGASLRGG